MFNLVFTMGDIDDLYKNEAEEIDNEFLEELKNTKNHDKSFSKYRKNLLRSRMKFKKKYLKFNELEKKRIRKIKKKIKKYPKFEHLNVEHFNFKFNFFEKLIMRLDILWFKFRRILSKHWSQDFPTIGLYIFYKIHKVSHAFYSDISYFFVILFDGLKNFALEISMDSWGFIKKSWMFILKITKKIIFWRKNNKEEHEKEINKEGITEKEK
jgi:hypothetical protein